MKNLITIDGPAASGKTSLSRHLAYKLGWQWLSTGVFYRGIAYLSLLKNVHSEEQIVHLIKTLPWSVRLDKEQTRFIYNEKDITSDIYTNEVDKCASKLARFAQVRQFLRPFQRHCYKESINGLVAEGRDCGTVVFTSAVLKVYLTASARIRAQRRVVQREEGISLDEVIDSQEKRDQQDITREASPLRQPEGALIIDAGHENIEKMVKKIYERYQELVKIP